ncbi:MAG: YciI family protein [Methyloligellaceae bacterium]
MLYSILIYGSEAMIETFTEADEAAVLEKHYALQSDLRAKGTLGPFGRLMPTTAAVTIRSEKSTPVVLDGPFAETKEQLLGFYLVECDTLEEAVETAKRLSMGVGALEVRPVHYYGPGVIETDDTEPAPKS